MTRTEALNCTYPHPVTSRIEAYGTDGNRWYRACRNSASAESTYELRRNEVGGISEHRLETLDPGPQVEWQPMPRRKPGNRGKPLPPIPPREWLGPRGEDGQLETPQQTVSSGTVNLRMEN